jgi:hypothetical protein
MTYEETVEYMISSKDDIRIKGILGPKSDILYSIFYEIKRQFDHLSNSDVPLDFDKEKISQDIKDISSFLRNVYLDSPITKEFSEYIKTFSLLILNWNSNTLNDEQIRANYSLLHRIYDGYLITSELFYYTRILLERVNLLKDFATPSVELSKMYLNFIDSGEKK